MSLDLFGAPEPPRPDVTLHREWLYASGLDFEGLLEDMEHALPWEQRSLKRYDQTTPMPRLECWASTIAGATYTYSGVRYEAQDIHDHPWLEDMLIEVTPAVENQYGVTPNAVFANLYRDGSDSIGWHSDDEPVLGPTRDVVIASLSIGARRRFVMKHRDQPDVRHEWSLGRGDLLLMGPGSQSEWLHSVPKTAKPVGVRINLTFRRVRA